MRRLNTSDYTSGSKTGGINEALAEMNPGDELVISGEISASESIKIMVPNILLLFEAATVDFGALPIVGFVLSAPHVTLYGDGASIIRNCGLSGIMLEAGSVKSRVEGLEVTAYNLSNSNGHAGIFGYKVGGPVAIKHCYTHDGNGNGIRLQNCPDSYVGYSHVGPTIVLPLPATSPNPQSMEGITAGPSGTIEGNLVELAYTTGILLYAVVPYCDLRVTDNTIRDCSQQHAGWHEAICLNANDTTISGVEIDGNRAYCTQSTPMMECLLGLYAGSSGIIQCGWGQNYQWNCTSANKVAMGISNLSTQLMDWQVD